MQVVPALAKQGVDGGEGAQRPLKDAQTIGDDQAVVGYRHPCPTTLEDAVEHQPAIPHARAAMNDQLVGRQVVGEVLSLDGGKLQRTADILAEPFGDFDAADVVVDGVVAARFGNKYPIARTKGIDGKGALGLTEQVAFEPCKQD